MAEEYNTIWTINGFNEKDNPEEIAKNIDDRIKIIVKEILNNYEPDTLVMLGSKAAYLINHYRYVLEKKGFNTCLERDVSRDVTEISGKKIKFNSAYVFVDSIHEGEELSEFINYYKEKKNKN